MNTSKRNAYYLIATIILMILHLGMASLGIGFMPRTIIGTGFFVWASFLIRDAR